MGINKTGLMGTALRVARQQQKISHEQLARRLGLERETIIAIEQGFHDHLFTEMMAVALELRVNLMPYLRDPGERGTFQTVKQVEKLFS